MLRIWLIDRNQIVAGGAVVGDRFAVLCIVVAIVASETTGIGGVTEVVGMGAPGYLHERKDVAVIDCSEGLGCLIDLGSLTAPDSRVSRLVELLQTVANPGRSFLLRGIVPLQQGQTLAMDEGQSGGWTPCGHISIQGVFGGLKGVSCAVVAIDAIHGPLYATGGIGASDGELRHSAVIIVLCDGVDGLMLSVGGDVVDAPKVRSVNAAEMAHGIFAADMQEHERVGCRVLLIVSKCCFDGEFVPNRSVGIVALFTGHASGWDFVSGEDWCRILVKDDHQELLGSVHLGVDEPRNAGCYVALRAGDTGVRRGVVSIPFRGHDVTGLAAEVRRIHVSYAAVAGCAYDDEIDAGGDDYEIDAVAEDGVSEVDFGKDGGNLTGRFKLSAA